jgi:hypothetical protein
MSGGGVYYEKNIFENFSSGNVPYDAAYRLL